MPVETNPHKILTAEHQFAQVMFIKYYTIAVVLESCVAASVACINGHMLGVVAILVLLGLLLIQAIVTGGLALIYQKRYFKVNWTVAGVIILLLPVVAVILVFSVAVAFAQGPG